MSKPKQQRARRMQRAALGLCYDCDSPAIPGITKCTAHRDAQYARARARRIARKAAGLCRWPGCNNPLVADHEHSAHRPRSAICNHCNSLVGKFESNAPLIARVVAYINGFTPYTADLAAAELAAEATAAQQAEAA